MFSVSPSGHDLAHQPDQSKPAIDLIDELLASATGKNNTLTPHDLSLISTKRRREARANNSEFTLSTFHKLFGSSKYVLKSFCDRTKKNNELFLLQLLDNAHHLRWTGRRP